MKTNEQNLLVKFIEEGKDAVKEDFHVFSLKDQKNKDDNGKNGERETVDRFGFGYAGLKLSVNRKQSIAGFEVWGGQFLRKHHRVLAKTRPIHVPT